MNEPVAYQTVEYDDTRWAIQIKDGKYAESAFIVHSVGITENEEETEATLNYKYELISGDIGEAYTEEFDAVVGDILIDIIEGMLEKE